MSKIYCSNTAVYTELSSLTAYARKIAEGQRTALELGLRPFLASNIMRFLRKGQ